MLNLNSILVSSDNPKKLTAFYRKVLEGDPDWEGEGYSMFTAGKGTLTIGPHDKVHDKSVTPERIIFNFETKDVKGEFERIKKLGAKVIAKPYQMGEDPGWIATFADPDNNYFQLMSIWK